ncbi:leucyl aminopeptidase family protein [Blastochloris viridis]|uniref:Peptidase B n=1 Tax=Blastochloris viridis TaxID=1079 RepID=A0A0H5BGL3_BLAVI|nr:leucyl aminopeptidase family protein [Blastochloris viridis]ALK10536.1 putative cytosol aminopeptidase [Blastochloris viridis]BAR99511.1 peptidase B [Blastochloris viridis]CUU43198.1 putative cytosol aminopeptidase [Blastochloris viridis]
MHAALIATDPAARPLWLVTANDWPAVREALGAPAAAFAEAAGFAPEPGRHVALPDADGALGGFLFGLGRGTEAADRLIAGKLAEVLPAGAWRLAVPPPEPALTVLAILLGSYRFTRYRSASPAKFRLVVPDGVDAEEVSRLAEAVFLVRDLVNTPANDLGPAELEDAVRAVAAPHGAEVTSIVGEDLLAAGFPLIHAVGKGSARAPRLIELRWGDPAHPKLTLVGKGVCFDTGGLDIKPASAMLLMKKDMGGAATALALAKLVMERALPVRLRLLVPAVENAISGTAFRPGDVYPSRKGLSIEVGDTDAEGRLVLADALALADAEAPDLLIDFATLTGAARVALGPDIPPAFTDDDDLAAALARHAAATADPVWRLPLWRPYASGLDSKVADLSSVAPGGFAGSIMAALFLARFVEAAKCWLHLDIYAWTPKPKPGRPEGGEAQTLRALDALLQDRFKL